MEIDWFTVGAQLVNFLILFALLAKFLYRPILDAVEARQGRIRERVEESERVEQEAQERKTHYQRQLDEFEERKDRMLEEARQEAEERRREWLEEARQEVRRTREKWGERLREEQQRQMADLRRRVGRELFAALRDAFRDLADRSVEARMVERLIDSLGELGEEAREGLRRELTDSETDASVVVKSRWELDASSRERIGAAIGEVVGRQPDIEFGHEEELLGGVEFRVGGRRYGWSFRSYLEGLDEQITEGMPRTGAEAGGEAAGLEDGGVDLREVGR